MFKNNSHFQEGCNYSFQDDTEEKENSSFKSNLNPRGTDSFANL